MGVICGRRLDTPLKNILCNFFIKLCNLYINLKCKFVNTNNNIEFLELYEPISNNFCSFCRALSCNSENSRDLIQDSILNALENFNKIKNKLAFKSYLFSIAINLHRMNQRKLKSQMRYNEKEIKEIRNFNPTQECLTDFKIIHEVILTLPEKVAETIILFHISDLLIEDIRKIQGGSISGVKLRLKRGRKKLLSILNAEKKIDVSQIIATY